MALIGDAAASSDPAFGQGLSLALRDARAMYEALHSTDDWYEAGYIYASQHDHYYSVVHSATNWYRTLFHDIAPEADARHARVLSRFAEEPSCAPEQTFSGPEAPINPAALQLYRTEMPGSHSART